MVTVSFTGHRPDKLFGSYDLDTPKSRLLAKNLLKLLEELIIEKKVDTFISGGAIGADQLAFICVNQLKKKYPHIKNIIAIPFNNQDIKWNKNDRKRYEKMKEKSDQLIFVDTIDKYKSKRENIVIGEYSPEKMQLRNMYMVDESQILIAIYDGTSGGTRNCYNYAVKNKKEIITIDPNNNFEIKKNS